MTNTIVAHPAAQPRFVQPRLARSTGAAGGWILGIAWTVLAVGLAYAGWMGWQGHETGTDAYLFLAAAVGVGTLLQFLILFSYAVLLRGMAHLLRRVG